MIELSKYDVVALDTETSGLSFWKDRAYALVYATPDGKADCLDLRKPEVLSWARREIPKIKCVVGHNLKFDIHFLRELGISIMESAVRDTMVAAALIDEHLPSYSLDFVGKKYVGMGKANETYQKLSVMFGGKATREAQMMNLIKAPWDVVRDYAIPDAVVTLKLWQWQEKELALQELGQVWDVEMRLLNVLVDIERRGVRVDVSAAERAVREISEIVRREQRALNDLAGFEVNPNPIKTIAQLFKPEKDDTGKWRLIDGTYADETEGGAASINADTLRRMKHPAASMILKLRQLIKTRDTFLLGHILGHHHDGVIHANFNQTKSDNDLGTGTGRLSCNAPALQQIHKRNKEVAQIVRAIFIPDEGQEWGSFDWDQFEFRWFGHYVRDPMINKAYRTDAKADFYSVISKITGLPRNPTPGIKGNAKQMTLASVFGMGAGKLAQEMGLPYTEEHLKDGRSYLKAGPEAQEVMQSFYDAIPGIKSYLDRAANVARSRGYVKTALGRHIRFPGGKFVHKAGGLILQGSAADSMKLKLIELRELLKDTDARIMLSVHDEIDISLPPDSEDLRNEIVRCYTAFGNDDIIQCDIPITCGPGYGENWFEASK
jgi:DNA polymerase I-like protein with 3'-5' exonuclease and polymerase domains